MTNNSVAAVHTPGPWRWELNEKHKSIHLVGGRPMFDLTIIEPTRWGMGSATLLIRDTSQYGFNIMHKLHERRDWIAPFAGRAHHADWCADVTHPDMRLMAAAPDLLVALKEIASTKASEHGTLSIMIGRCMKIANDAIARATGVQP